MEPDGVIELVDQAWQDNPEWRPGDTWTACWGPSLVADAPPYPGIAVRTIDSRAVPLRKALKVQVQHDVPDGHLHRVASTVLCFGQAGAYLSVGSTSLEVPLAAGDYSAEVWVDAPEPSLVSQVAIWLRAEAAD